MGVLSGGGWWQHAEQVVAPWAGAVEEQEPRCLEVVQGRDLIQKSLVAGPGLAEVVSLVFWCANGGSEDIEPSLLGRECRVSDPNVCSKRFQVGRRDARKVPTPSPATACFKASKPCLKRTDACHSSDFSTPNPPHTCGTTTPTHPTSSNRPRVASRATPSCPHCFPWGNTLQSRPSIPSFRKGKAFMLTSIMSTQWSSHIG